MKKRFPELVYCRNITYKEALQGRLDQLERKLFQAVVTVQETVTMLKRIGTEQRQWKLGDTPEE